MAELENNGTDEQSQTNGLEDEGPIAMIYEPEMGWVPEPKGPNCVYWRRIKREKVSNSPKPKQKSSRRKRFKPNHLQEIDPNVPISKKAKGKDPVGKKYANKDNVDGGMVEAAMQPHRAQWRPLSKTAERLGTVG